MRRILVLAVLLWMPNWAAGAVMSLTSGGLSTIPISPGGTAPVLLSVDTQGVQIAGFQTQLHSPYGALLTVSNWTFNGGFSFNAGTLNGSLATDTGPATGLALSNQGPGIVTLGSFTLTVDPAFQPTFPLILATVNTALSDANAQPLPVSEAGIRIPEPMSLLLLAMGLTLLRRRR